MGMLLVYCPTGSGVVQTKGVLWLYNFTLQIWNLLAPQVYEPYVFASRMLWNGQVNGQNLGNAECVFLKNGKLQLEHYHTMYKVAQHQKKLFQTTEEKRRLKTCISIYKEYSNIRFLCIRLGYRD